MIPWRLRYTGIRDYEATNLDLAGNTSHILILGPNGSGKSTITFCMGAALYSSKVDIEGLKSNNLPVDTTWRAKIEFLFKNDGNIKVDAPTFVQFRLDIEQHPGEPIKKEFHIEEGDVVDDWERTMKFTSGNFTEYKNQLFYKYAVDPDNFYLIWYQKEVNQFAIMHPEERFRIFSEMNGIDTIQKNWEQSKELVRETEKSLEEAEGKQGLNQVKLKTKENELERYYDRNRRLREGFKQYYQSLSWLEGDYEKQVQQLKDQIETLKDTREDTKEELVSQQIALEQATTAKKEIETEVRKIENEDEKVSEELTSISKQKKATEKQLTKLSKKIETITDKVQRIDMSEQELLTYLAEAKEQQLKDESARKKQEETLRHLQEKLVESIGQYSELNVQIKQDQAKEQEVRKLIKEYKSSTAIQAEMTENENHITKKKDRLLEITTEKARETKEYTNLKHNKVLNSRQEEAVKYFERKNVEVFPLRELLELDAHAKLKDEKMFDTIKYTMFINQKQFVAPNDLYYVSLPNIIPEQAMTHLPDKHLSIKTAISDQLYPYALKAIWWVHLFFSDKHPQIIRGQLVDQRGIRGPQEGTKIILSEKMLQHYRSEVQQKLEQLDQEEVQLEMDIKALNDMNSKLFNRRERLKEAEAFLIAASDREWRQRQYEKLKEDEVSLKKEQQNVQNKINSLNTSLALLHERIKKYRNYEEVFVEYKKEKERIDEVRKLREEITRLTSEQEKKEQYLNDIQVNLDAAKRKFKLMERKIDDLESKQNRYEREQLGIERQIEIKVEEHLTNEEAYSRTSLELQRLNEATVELYQQFTEDIEVLPEWTQSKAKEVRQQGEITYTQAIQEQGIDEAAPENYQKMKDEFDRSADEVKKSKLLLEEYSERMEHLKEELEETIQMKMLSVHHKFVNYMSMFGFEGKVDWTMYEDKRGQARYTLAIKARKEGHRGRIEDVSEKARGGKHGKGVSGGEESLSSLLFALALLQTIEATPGYIVLDEFDSALDEGRKEKVFTLYEQELNRKMIIITPKSHEPEYLYRFSKAYVVYHDSSIPKSNVIKIKQSNGTEV